MHIYTDIAGGLDGCVHSLHGEVIYLKDPSPYHGRIQVRYHKVGNGIGLAKSHILGHYAPLKISKGLTNLRFAPTDTTVFVRLCSWFCRRNKKEIDIPFGAQSASDCAEEIPQAAEQYK